MAERTIGHGDGGARLSLQDQKAAAALMQLLESMRASGRKGYRIETVVDKGEAVRLRVVEAKDEVKLQNDK
jgi:hypothetical protein